MNDSGMGIGDVGRRGVRHVHTSAATEVFAPRRVLGTIDAARLRGLIASRAGARSPLAYALERLISRAELVAPSYLPADVVTMDARVLCTTPRGLVSGEPERLFEATLVYPWDASLEDGRVSVLSDLGLAMLGNRIGARVEARNWLGTPVQWGLSQMIHRPEAVAAPVL